MYYNLLRVINDEFSQQANMSRHTFPLKNNFKNYRKYFSKLFLVPNYIYYFFHSNHICINCLPSQVKFS
jgi:hypothetical protein